MFYVTILQSGWVGQQFFGFDTLQPTELPCSVSKGTKIGKYFIQKDGF